MEKKESLNKARMLELETSTLIEKMATAIADGEILIDVRVDGSPLHYHPWLSELRPEYRAEKEFTFVETLVLDRAVLHCARSGTLGFTGRGFLENAINGNAKQFKKDIAEHAVDLKYDENHFITDFKIKLKDITAIKIMNIIV